jgi:hypothetical protein
MSFATKRAILIKWIELATGYPVGKVIWADQNMPRPEKPYIVARMSAFKTINREFTHPADETGKADISTHKEFTLSIQCFATDAIDPMPIMLDLQDSLNKSKFMEMFNPEGLVFVESLMGPTDTTIKLDTVYERRASMDLRMRMPWVVGDSEQGLIESVNVEQISIDVGGITIMPNLITIGLPFIPPEINITDYLFVSIDTLNSIIKAKSPLDIIDNFTYYEDTVVEIDGVSANIDDLLVDDELDITYFEYLDKKVLKFVDATRPI